MTKTIHFSSYSSIKIGPSVDVFLLDSLMPLPLDYRLIGGANNLLISPTPPPLAMLDKSFDFIRLEENVLHVGGATPSGKILSFAKKHNLASFELMQKLPGTLGGMVAMNAGLKEWEVFNNLRAIRTENGWIEKSKINHGYRFANIDGIVYEATFTCNEGFDESLLAMFKQMRDNQPKEASAGSCFKNPKGHYAGKLIEEAGFKGKRIGAMMFSPVHANFLVNTGGGTFEDALKLITEVKAEVFKRFGVELEEEIIIL
ncbi:UDP-N-acetylmuramate dehydrogenase [Sulfurospirillum barnesii]|uniref:UDP-N-acetylenolpyruvoylglucosamine reductase n=1 Tax=Sulfurospirillum barnesii (strain ATCC 700032 / DSM 10660 / SES-3) TaxID=760154 RepID=I3Y0M0_SULBS|nr:UDP-N-acetylmuramate dehydrogenase [Sulfurospirillum barnesii]AFL69744.1 UDP-N-acetylmuramate dehydrogenase [Sulfurospirillum barnesii SES-3]